MAMSRVLKVLNKAYSPQYLVYTNIASGGLMMAGAETALIKLEGYVAGEDKPLDWTRIRSMGYGGLVFGTLGHYWYTFLDRRFPGNSLRTVAKKVACEIPAGPPFALAFFVVVGQFRNKSLIDSWTSFKEGLTFILIADWGFYLPLQILNFRYLPPKYRYLYVVFINGFYDCAFAYIINRPLHSVTSVKKLPSSSDTQLELQNDKPNDSSKPEK
ncbi:Mpv17-like protein 2 [Halotydeus destructor]|nr:Mpv17-like protein 2 [Halotydeus destructor]